MNCFLNYQNLTLNRSIGYLFSNYKFKENMKKQYYYLPDIYEQGKIKKFNSTKYMHLFKD